MVAPCCLAGTVASNTRLLPVYFYDPFAWKHSERCLMLRGAVRLPRRACRTYDLDGLSDGVLALSCLISESKSPMRESWHFLTARGDDSGQYPHRKARVVACEMMVPRVKAKAVPHHWDELPAKLCRHH